MTILLTYKITVLEDYRISSIGNIGKLEKKIFFVLFKYTTNVQAIILELTS